MKIIVPTDFSKFARNAVDYAADFAVKHNAELILLHTYLFRYSESSFFIDYDQSVKEVAKNQLTIEKNRIIEEFPGLKKSQITLRCEVGGLIENIDRFNKDVSLVIMGTKGRSGWEEVLIGSQAASVIENCDIPVLVIPKKAKFEKQSKIAYAVDFSTDLSEKDLDLMQFFVSKKTDLNLFHNYTKAIDIDSDKESELTEKFKSSFPDANSVLLDLGFDDSKVANLEEYLHELKPSMVVAKSRHKNFFQKIFSVSVTKTLAYHMEVPLLVLKE